MLKHYYVCKDLHKRHANDSCTQLSNLWWNSLFSWWAVSNGSGKPKLFVDQVWNSSHIWELCMPIRGFMNAHCSMLTISLRQWLKARWLDVLKLLNQTISKLNSCSFTMSHFPGLSNILKSRKYCIRSNLVIYIVRPYYAGKLFLTCPT